MKQKPNPEIEVFLDSLRDEREHIRDSFVIVSELQNVARFCYNQGRGRWLDVCRVVLIPGQSYLVRRVWWKSMKRRGVATYGNVCLARWRSGMLPRPWEVLTGSLPGSTALLAGIQVYV
jgi:hypothetical protein